MSYTTLISAEELAEQYRSGDWAVVDCRFSLADASLGRRKYLEAHILGAVYAHLDEDLSGPIVPGVTGRHPLPEPDAFARTAGKLGIGEGAQVVAYDDTGGAIASRLWWMLRWLGHGEVAVLDGGWPIWQQSGYPVRGGQESREPRKFVARPRSGGMVSTEEVYAQLESPSLRLFDARSPQRYRGEDEDIDPVAGHIPGAISAPYADNLEADGRFRPVDELRERYEQLLGDIPLKSAAFYCGSGVTAAHDLLALAHIGMDGARLYPGSWSEWIANPDRPVAVGENP
jgi:thiosulfate/3-mercaptopyruvate sulfurtransferase